ncbi:MAG: MBL fold metallo-hydrolase [Vicinamibacterales bacterium]|jgi:glyoxylase-like metal-dependent hydrolase (beta-lactamase superfamily II)|nr:MBL fold metallo-hydrolase [Vicinamibacterales bacterium]
MKREFALGVLVLGGGLVMACAGAGESEAPAEAPASTEAAPPVAEAPPENVVEVERLEDNLFVLRGGGGNSAAFITSDGVVLVDTKLTGWGQPLIDAIGELTSNPITTIINTHAHFDHVDGSVEFPATVEFVAHENTQRLMRENNPVRALQTEPRPSPFDGDAGVGIPETTFTDTLTLGSDGDTVELHYFGRAHTGGDTWVVFPSLRTVHAGDAFPNTMVPIMDLNNGGSGVDYPETLRKASEGLTDVDRVITGHGPVMTPGDLSDYADFVAGFVTAAQDAKAAGTSAADFIAGWEPSGDYADYTKGPAERLTVYVQDIYDATE